VKILSLIATAFLVAGCSTVHQAPVQAKVGVPIHRFSDGSIELDAAMRDRYNGLVAVYGSHRLENGAPVFIPALKKDDGVTPIGPGLWKLDPEHVQDFVVLADLKRRGAKP
jgi:hypothetical protein